MRRNSHRPRRAEPKTPTVSQAQHRRETAICGSLSLLTGAAFGAALMYALDPEAGERRRRAAYEAATGALDSAGHAIGDAYHSAAGSVGHTLQNLGEQVAGSASAAAANIPSAQEAVGAGQRLFDRATESAQSYRDAAKRRARAWVESARSLIPQRRRPTDVSAVSASAVALGAIAAGVSAMWFLDPDRGRARRAWIRQKSTHFLNETGRFMFTTGRHLRNRSRGYIHEAGSLLRGERPVDLALAERVRLALGRIGFASSSIGVSSDNGNITLTGRCSSDELDRILAAVRKVSGVREIENQMQIGEFASTWNM